MRHCFVPCNYIKRSVPQERSIRPAAQWEISRSNQEKVSKETYPVCGTRIAPGDGDEHLGHRHARPPTISSLLPRFYASSTAMYHRVGQLARQVSRKLTRAVQTAHLTRSVSEICQIPNRKRRTAWAQRGPILIAERVQGVWLGRDLRLAR